MGSNPTTPTSLHATSTGTTRPAGVGIYCAPITWETGASMSREPSPELRERIENTHPLPRRRCGREGGLAAIRALPWGSRGRPSSCGISTCASIPAIRSGRCATASCSRTATPRCCSTALLHLFGYALSLDEIVRFRQLGSKTPGHPEFGETPGVEVTTGPLGQGFAHGVGMALAGRLARARFGVGGRGPWTPYRVRHRVRRRSDGGDLLRGGLARGAPGAREISIYLWDDNRISIDGPTSLCFGEDVAKRFEAQRWQVQQVDGEDHRRPAPRAGGGARGDGPAVARDHCAP